MLFKLLFLMHKNIRKNSGGTPIIQTQTLKSEVSTIFFTRFPTKLSKNLPIKSTYLKVQTVLKTFGRCNEFDIFINFKLCTFI
jgi:hypothetical protein